MIENPIEIAIAKDAYVVCGILYHFVIGDHISLKTFYESPYFY